MQKHLLYFDLCIHLQARQIASVSVNRKWRSLDEIIIFRDRDLDFWTQHAIIYQKLHGKWNFFLRMHVKKHRFNFKDIRRILYDFLILDA